MGEVHVTDPASIAARGVYAGSLSTRLASEYDAENRALLTLARQAEPAWILDGVAVHLQMIPDDAATSTGEVLDLEVSSLISVASMPVGSPYTETVLWVEGWTETIASGAWRIEFAISDYCRTAALQTWDDVDATTTWNTAPDISWDDVGCVPPVVAGDSWNAVPAATHWDTVPATITWDTAEALWPS